MLSISAEHRFCSEYKRQIQSLELRLAQMEELADRKLSDENSALKTEVEELQATVQTLKAQTHT